MKHRSKKSIVEIVAELVFTFRKIASNMIDTKMCI